MNNIVIGLLTVSQLVGTAGFASSVGPVSPRALAVMQGHMSGGATPQTGGGELPSPVLDLLVIWRGSPGWYEGYRSLIGDKIVLADGRTVELARFDEKTRTATIAGHPVRLDGNNLILVDNVDGTPRVAGVLRVESTFPQGDALIELVRRTPRLAEFVK